MIIRTNKTQLDSSDIARVVQNHAFDAAHKIKLKNYYLGRHGILGKQGRNIFCCE